MMEEFKALPHADLPASPTPDTYNKGFNALHW